MTNLRTATGLTIKDRTALRAAAAQLLGTRLGAAPDSLATPNPSTPAPTEDLLTKLVAAKFIGLAGVGGSSTPVAADFVASASRVLELGGPGHAVPIDVIPAVAAGVFSGGTPAVVGQAFTKSDATPDRASWIDGVAEAAAIRNHVSTVDDVESVEGRVGATLALAELSLGSVGNYGVDRERAVPEKLGTVPSAK